MMKPLKTLETVCEDFKWYYENGFITPRDGNAVAYEKGNYIVTISGRDKSKLNFSDFITVNERGVNLDNRSGVTPSIETLAHIAAQENTNNKASVHVHSPNTVALFLLFEKRENGIGVGDLEESLNKRWPELFRYTKIGMTVPFLEPGSQSLHQAIAQSFQIDKPDIVVMQRHGIMAVGQDFGKCKEHLLRLEHISTILLKTLSASGGKLEKIL